MEQRNTADSGAVKTTFGCIVAIAIFAGLSFAFSKFEWLTWISIAVVSVFFLAVIGAILALIRFLLEKALRLLPAESPASILVPAFVVLASASWCIRMIIVEPWQNFGFANGPLIPVAALVLVAASGTAAERRFNFKATGDDERPVGLLQIYAEMMMAALVTLAVLSGLRASFGWIF